MPLSLIPFCPFPPSVRSFKLPRPSRIFVLSTDRSAPLATLFHSRRYSRPFRRRRRITEILKYGILLALLAPPSSTYDAAKLNFLSCRLLGVCCTRAVWIFSLNAKTRKPRVIWWLQHLRDHADSGLSGWVDRSGCSSRVPAASHRSSRGHPDSASYPRSDRLA